MAAVNYAKEYQSVLSNAWPHVLRFGALYAAPNNGRFRFLRSNIIEVPTLTTTGRKEASRDAIVEPGRHWDNGWVPLELTNHRYWDTLVHPRDIEQTNMAASIANITKTYNEQQKFPEMDAYTISKIYADFVELGKTVDTTAITTDNVLTVFDGMYQQLIEDLVPMTGLILYVTPAVNTTLKNAKALSRQLAIGPQKAVVERALASLDEVKIEVVPSVLMKTLYDFSDGWTPAGAAKQINMALIQPQSIITPVTYSAAALDEPCAKTNMQYYYYEESDEDVFILPNKETGIAFNTEA